MVKRFFLLFLICDIVFITISLIFFDINFLLNNQLAFFCSLFITIASFLGYKRSISQKVDNIDRSMMSENDRDSIDEIDDPYDLYSEEVVQYEDKELSANEIKTIIQDEKKRIKRNSLKNMFSNASGYISVYRISGYILLVVCFFALNNHGVFNPVGFLLGLAIVPLGAVFSNFILNKDS